MIIKPKPAIEKSPDVDVESIIITSPKAVQKLDEVVAESTPKTPTTELDSSRTGSARNSERLFQCPGCDLDMRASLIRRHILSKHPNIALRRGITDGDALEKALAKANTTPTAEIIRVKPMNDLLEKKEVMDVRPKPLAAINSVPSSEACILCAAPDCNKYIHHSNMARHWRCWHPDLNKANFVMKRPSFSKSTPTSPNSSPIKVAKTADSQVSQSLFKKSADRRTSIEQQQPSKEQANAAVNGFNLPMANGLYACKTGDCDYKTRYNSNMWRHRRKYNHFLDTDVSFENCHTAVVQQQPDDASGTLIDKSKEVDATDTDEAAKDDEPKTERPEDPFLVVDESESIDASMYEEVEEIEEMDFESNTPADADENKDDKAEIKEIEEVKTPKSAERNASTSDSIIKETNPTKAKSVSTSENDKTADLLKSPAEKSRNKITSYFLPLAKSTEKVVKVETPTTPSDAEKVKKNIAESMDTSECNTSGPEKPVSASTTAAKASTTAAMDISSDALAEAK